VNPLRRVWFIDFPQAVNPRMNANACGLFHRDVDRLRRWFERFGVQVDAAGLSADLLRRFLTAQL
jgi:serine/threonine-protein kinase RIO1